MYLRLNLMACLDLLWLRIFLLQQQCVSCSTHDLDLIPMYFSLLFLLLNVNQFVLLLWSFVLRNYFVMLLFWLVFFFINFCSHVVCHVPTLKYGDYLQNLRLFSLDEKVLKSFSSSFINLLLYVFLSYTKPSSFLNFMAILKSLIESIWIFFLWWQLFMDQISFSIPQKYKFEMGFSFLIVTDLFFKLFPKHRFR